MTDRKPDSGTARGKTKSNRPRKSSDDKELTTRVTVDFDVADVRLDRSGPYTNVHLRGAVPRGDVGDPALPWKPIRVSVPADCVLRGIEVDSSKVKHLAKGVLLEPCQPDAPTIFGEATPWVDAKREHYEARDQWPESLQGTPKLRQKGGFLMAEVELCPFRYDPVERVLDFIQRMVVTIKYTRSGRPGRPIDTPYRARLTEKYAARVEAAVLNPDRVREYVGTLELDVPFQPIVLPTYDCVIVTSQLDSLDQEFERLAHWRTIMGLRTRVVTVQDIVANSVPHTRGAHFYHNSGYSDGGTRDLAEAIRNFLKWAVEHWSIDYVLLGGDTDIIPCRYALHTKAGSAGYRDLTESQTYKSQLLYSLSASSHLTGSGPLNVGDDDPATVWECDPGDNDPWLGGHLGVNRPINRVDLSWGPNHATAYVIEISDDGVTWTPIHSESAGAGGSEQIDITPTSAKRLRLRVTSGSGFSLGSLGVYGPWRYNYGGTAYDFGTTASRIYLTVGMVADPTIDDPQVLIGGGPKAGTVVPYNVNCSGTSLGWRFIDRLTDGTPVVSNTPTYFVEIRGPAANHGHSFALKTTINYIPTDLYYSDMLATEYPTGNEHDWDQVGNLVYGERYGGEIDGVNGIPDVFVGRAPASARAEAATFVDKVIDYECYRTHDAFGISYTKPLDLATSILLGSENWNEDTAGVLDWSAKGKESIRAYLQGVNPNLYDFTRRYQDKDDVPAADQGPDLDGSGTTEIVAGIEANNHVVSLTSHGGPGYICGLYTSDMEGLENYPGLIYANACLSNKFDKPSGDAVGEHALLNDGGGGVAFVGNTRFGWMGDNPMELEFWTNWACCERLGEAFNAAKDPTFGGWQAYSLNLLGDPGMRVWNGTPQQIEVNHPDDVCTGNQPFTVEVLNNGQPVADALVCITMGSSLHDVATTDATGHADLSLSNAVQGTLRVTVSGRNLLPYLGSAEVITCLGGCNLIVACGSDITCAHAIECGPAVACGSAVACAHAIECAEAIHGGCLMLLGGCGMAIDMCPTILPREWEYFDYFRDQWAITDLAGFAARMDEPEIRNVLNETPEALRRPLLAMLERIRAEEDA